MEQNADIPIYVQIISGTILGVALGNLLTGAVRFVQQPKNHQFNALHGLWIIFLLLSIFIFWWQEGLAYSVSSGPLSSTSSRSPIARPFCS